MAYPFQMFNRNWKEFLKPKIKSLAYTPEELEKAAFQYAINHSSAPDKETPDWIIADFKAGAQWAALQPKEAEVWKDFDKDWEQAQWIKDMVLRYEKQIKILQQRFDNLSVQWVAAQKNIEELQSAQLKQEANEDINLVELYTYFFSKHWEQDYPLLGEVVALQEYWDGIYDQYRLQSFTIAKFKANEAVLNKFKSALLSQQQKGNVI